MTIKNDHFSAANKNKAASIALADAVRLGDMAGFTTLYAEKSAQMRIDEILVVAIQHGQTTIAERIVQDYKTFDRLNMATQSSLPWRAAIEKGDAHFIDMLVKGGVSPQDIHLWRMAATRGDGELIEKFKTLLPRGNKEQLACAYIEAATCGHSDLLKSLVESKEESGYKPHILLTAAEKSLDHGYLDAALFSVRLLGDIRSASVDGTRCFNNMLVRAAAHGADAILQEMLPFYDESLDAHFRHAAEGNHASTIDLLMTHVRDQRPDLNVPLVAATKRGFYAAADRLLVHGADTSAFHNNAMIYALEHYHKDDAGFVQRLLEHGADRDIALTAALKTYPDDISLHNVIRAVGDAYRLAAQTKFDAQQQGRTDFTTHDDVLGATPLAFAALHQIFGYAAAKIPKADLTADLIISQNITQTLHQRDRLADLFNPLLWVGARAEAVFLTQTLDSLHSHTIDKQAFIRDIDMETLRLKKNPQRYRL